MTSISLAPVLRQLGSLKRLRDAYLSCCENIYNILSGILCLLSTIILISVTYYSYSLNDSKHNALSALKELLTI